MQVGTAGFLSIQMAWVITNALGQRVTQESFALISTLWDNMSSRTALRPPLTAYHIGMPSYNHSGKCNRMLAERLQNWCTTSNFIHLIHVKCYVCCGCLSWYSSHLNICYNMDIGVELCTTRICHDRPWCTKPRACCRWGYLLVQKRGTDNMRKMPMMPQILCWPWLFCKRKGLSTMGQENADNVNVAFWNCQV